MHIGRTDMECNMSQQEYNSWWFDHYQEQEQIENELMELHHQHWLEMVSRYEEHLADCK